MKIAITGTHSSGKSTLAKLCSDHFGLKLVRGDPIRRIMRQYFPGKSFDGLTKEECWRRENMGLLKRIKAEKKETSFVSDGCTLNSIAYAEATIGEGVYAIENFDNFSCMATGNAKLYDFIFYLPPEIPLVNDGFRPMSEGFRLLVDRILLQILKGHIFYKVSGTLESRLRQIEEKIRNNNTC